MTERAGDIAPVGANALADITARAAGQDGAVAFSAGVDRAERGSGEGSEHARMLSDRFRHALATDQPGADELASVALVDARAGGTGGFAAVAARDMQHAAWFRIGAVGHGHFAGSQANGGYATTQADRMAAGVSGRELAFPRPEVSYRHESARSRAACAARRRISRSSR